MGCVASRIDKEERVSICKERKRLMKQLLVYRKEFADAQLGYLRALKNTGVTLRQFTESELLEPEDIPFKSVFLPSPPPPLPPSPPPPPAFSPDSRKFEGTSPPAFSPDLRKFEGNQPAGNTPEKVIEIDDDNGNTPPPPSVLSSSWDFWDAFGSSSPQYDKMSEIVEQEEEENWAETKSEFVEEDEESETIVYPTVNVLPEKRQPLELWDDTSSMMSWQTKDTADVSMIVRRSKKSLAGIVRELDDYFLEASASGKDVAVLMDFNVGETFLYRFKESKRKRYNSIKVISALTWSWFSKSLQSRRGSREHSRPDEPRKPGAHCITLEKIYAEEQKLYKLVKEEEITKVEHERKSFLLQQQEEENQDWTKTEKTRSTIESLQSDILSLKQSIRRTCSTILKLINEELHPQMISLTSGLMHMWQTMYECHQVQNHISQQLTNLTDQLNMDPTSEYQRQAASQLKTEVNSWYGNFCKLVKAQREYVQAICRWSQLTDCLLNEGERSIGPSSVHALSEEWLLALDKLPEKMASEAIKGLLSAVHSIVQQQDQEVHQQKRSNKLEKKLQKESHFLAEMEMKFAGSFTTEGANSVWSSKHPLSIKRDKVEVLKKQVDYEKAKYMNSVKVTQAMILHNLQTSLPSIFQALMGFSSTYTRAFEAVLSRATRIEHDDGSLSLMS